MTSVLAADESLSNLSCTLHLIYCLLCPTYVQRLPLAVYCVLMVVTQGRVYSRACLYSVVVTVSLCVPKAVSPPAQTSTTELSALLQSPLQASQSGNPTGHVADGFLPSLVSYLRKLDSLHAAEHNCLLSGHCIVT